MTPVSRGKIVHTTALVTTVPVGLQRTCLTQSFMVNWFWKKWNLWAWSTCFYNYAEAIYFYFIVLQCFGCENTNNWIRYPWEKNTDLENDCLFSFALFYLISTIYYKLHRLYYICFLLSRSPLIFCFHLFVTFHVICGFKILGLVQKPLCWYADLVQLN